MDCPTLTAAGKNSADIHMVIAILDLLADPTHFDEIILMSSDADFTPALARIRRCDRRTVVVASGPYSPVLQASCDHLVPVERFVHEALKGPTGYTLRQTGTASSSVRATVESAPATSAAAKKTTKAAAKKTPVKETAAKKSLAKTVAGAVKGEEAVTVPAKAATKQNIASGTKSPAEPVTTATAMKAAVKRASAKTLGSTSGAAVAAGGSSVAPRSLSVAARRQAGDAVRAVVADSSGPVKLTSVAGPVRSALGDLAADWDGANGLKKLLQELRLEGLYLSDVPPGYVYDSDRHLPPGSPS